MRSDISAWYTLLLYEINHVLKTTEHRDVPVGVTKRTYLTSQSLNLVSRCCCHSRCLWQEDGKSQLLCQKLWWIGQELVFHPTHWGFLLMTSLKMAWFANLVVIHLEEDPKSPAMSPPGAVPNASQISLAMAKKINDDIKYQLMKEVRKFGWS